MAPATAAGALGFTIARSRSAFSILKPIALLVTNVLSASNAPPTPTNKLTSSSLISIIDASLRSLDSALVRGSIAVGSIKPLPFTSTSTVRFTIVKLPRARTKPDISRATVPEAFSSSPKLPSKSISMELPPPVLTVCLLPPSKSITVALATLLLVPPALLMETVRFTASIITLSMPINPALPTVAFSAIHVLRSVAVVVPVGVLFCNRISAKSTSSSDKPIAVSLSPGPFTPANAFKSEAPSVNRSRSVTTLPSASVALAIVDFSKAKFPPT